MTGDHDSNWSLMALNIGMYEDLYFVYDASFVESVALELTLQLRRCTTTY